MKKEYDFFSLYYRFIRDSQTGKRLKKNGAKILPQTIGNYKNVLKMLESFSEEKDFHLRFRDYNKLNTREKKTEKNYWKKFYKKFTDYLYKDRKCFDNYVGSNIKVIRVFFNYVRRDLDIPIGEYHLLFYVRKEEVPIITLTPERLRFLMHDTDFHQSLTPGLKNAKNILVFGCLTGLRYSDLLQLKKKNIIHRNGAVYLQNKSQKTKARTQVKLPAFAINYLKTNPYKKKGFLLRVPQLTRFNCYIKQIAELAEWTEKISKYREIQGKEKRILQTGKEYRFCDLVTSHIMRRTAVTNMLITGMPEYVVRRISGHSANSNSFSRYVSFAQAYLDEEIDKFHQHLEEDL